MKIFLINNKIYEAKYLINIIFLQYHKIFVIILI
jgi:hypothetical protein